MTTASVVLLIAVLACLAIAFWMMRGGGGGRGRSDSTDSRAGDAQGESRP